MPEIYNALPPNLEYLVSVGLDLDAILQLNEDDNEEERENKIVDSNEDIVVTDEVDDEIPEQSDPDPFLIRHLRAVLPYLTRFGFRFDFNVTLCFDQDQDQDLQLTDRASRKLVASTKALGITLGI